MTKRVAIIGAGMAGLTCARSVAAAGYEVVVFDKARGPGGRLPTRRRDGVAFDHGAPYFSARGAAFKDEVDRWRDAGVAGPWKPRRVQFAPSGPPRILPPETVWLGQPRMSAIGRSLSESLDVRLACRIAVIEREGDHWTLQEESGRDHRGFGVVVSTVPPVQATELLAGLSVSGLSVAGRAADARAKLSDAADAMVPRWSLMLSFEAPFDPGFDVAEFNGPVLERAIRNEAKPLRDPTPAWVVHASAGWSHSCLEAPPAEVAEQIETALRARIPGLPATTSRDTHRWRYATANPQRERGVIDAGHGLLLGGDWTCGAELEDAFASGQALAAAAVSRLQ